MTRVKRGTTSLKKRRNILKKTKGYRFGRSKKERQAREAISHAGTHAFAHRRDKKNDFRRLWNIRINAAVRNIDNSDSKVKLTYSKFMNMLKKKEVGLDRKILSSLAQENPEVFEKIVRKVS
jgi:large subunit ribosomal protein L20